MEFIVEGTPQGKARPRFSKKSGTVYTPAKTAKYEKLIRKAFLGAGGKAIGNGKRKSVRNIRGVFVAGTPFRNICATRTKRELSMKLIRNEGENDSKKNTSPTESIREMSERITLLKNWIPSLTDTSLIFVVVAKKNGNTDSFRVSNQCDACLKSWLDRKYIALRGDV